MLVGIGVNAVLAALNNVLILRTDLPTAVAAQSWLVGTLNGRGWAEVVAVAIALAVLVPVAWPSAAVSTSSAWATARPRGGRRPSRAPGWSPCCSASRSSGSPRPPSVPSRSSRSPRPQLARRLTGTTGPAVVPAALMGGVLLLAGDVLGQRLVAPRQVPAGTMTAAIGGLYLVWLLAREWRAGR